VRADKGKIYGGQGKSSVKQESSDLIVEVQRDGCGGEDVEAGAEVYSQTEGAAKFHNYLREPLVDRKGGKPSGEQFSLRGSKGRAGSSDQTQRGGDSLVSGNARLRVKKAKIEKILRKRGEGPYGGSGMAKRERPR